MIELNYYDITLTPEERFFFGGEVIFGQANEPDQRRRSYLVRSRVLPQQTSLLGMLRYEILRANSCLAPYAANKNGECPKWDKAGKLVGKTGFTVDAAKPETDKYGMIKALSPLLLYDGERHWYPVPVDDHKTREGKMSWGQRAGRYWVLENYDPKEGLSHCFSDGTYDGDEKKPVPENDLFEAVALTGNRISNRQSRPDESSEGDEEGLFRQTFYANKADRKLAFTFRVRVIGEVLEQLRTDVAHQGAAAGAEEGEKSYEESDTGPTPHRVTLGGEHGTFLMQVTHVATVEHDDDVDTPAGPDEHLLDFVAQDQLYRINTETPSASRNNETATPTHRRIVFLSDVRLPEAVMKKCESQTYFLVGETIPFRYLVSPLEQADRFASVRWYGSDETVEEGNAKDTDKSTTHGRRKEIRAGNLLRRGSVLIVPYADAPDVVHAIHQMEPYHQIGYNYCTHE